MNDLMSREDVKKLVSLLNKTYETLSIEVYIRGGDGVGIVNEFDFKISTKGGYTAFYAFIETLKAEDFGDIEELSCDIDIWFDGFNSHIEGGIRL